MEYIEYRDYAVKVARRFVRYRRSSMIDEHDLANSALALLWEVQSQKGELEESVAKRTIRLSMLSSIRSSAVVRPPKNVNLRQALQAYQQVSTYSPKEEPSFTPVDDWIDEEPIRQIWLMVEGLPKEDRYIVSLIWEQGCSIQDAADILYLSKSQVHRRYQEVLKKIKSQLLVKKRTAR